MVWNMYTSILYLCYDHTPYVIQEYMLERTNTDWGMLMMIKSVYYHTNFMVYSRGQDYVRGHGYPVIREKLHQD